MYRIEFVDDHVLPEGHDFMLLTNDAGSALLFYRRSAVTPANLEDSWAAYRALREEQSPPPTTMRERRLESVDARRLA
jgi:hypothetical protein